MNTILQPVNFSLVKVNPTLTKGETNYRARIKSNGTVTLEEIAALMAERTPNWDASTCWYFVNLFETIVRDQTRRGYCVQSDLFRTGLSVRGTFPYLDSPHDAATDTVCPTLTPTPAFKAAVADANLRNTAAHVPPATLCGVMDTVTHRAGIIAPGHEIHIEGRNLALDPDHPDEGVFLVDDKGLVVATATILESDAQTIACRFETCPPPGTYSLRAITRNGADAALKPTVATMRNIRVGDKGTDPVDL